MSRPWRVTAEYDVDVVLADTGLGGLLLTLPYLKSEQGLLDKMDEILATDLSLYVTASRAV